MKHIQATPDQDCPPELTFAAVKLVSHFLAHESNKHVPVLLEKFKVDSKLIDLLKAGSAGVQKQKKFLENPDGGIDTTNGATNGIEEDQLTAESDGEGYDREAEEEAEAKKFNDALVTQAQLAAMIHMYRESLVAMSNLVCGPQAAVAHALDKGLLPALVTAWDAAPGHGVLSIVLQHNVIWTYLNLVKNPETTGDQIHKVFNESEGGNIKGTRGGREDFFHRSSQNLLHDQ